MDKWETTWLNPPKKKKRRHEEADEQTKVCVYLEKQGYLFFAIPNGGKRGFLEAVRLKAQGLKPGVPDLCVAEPRGAYAGLYIEMKKRSGGVVGENQVWWKNELQKRGYRSEVCKGADAAIAVIEEYFNAGFNMLFCSHCGARSE